MTVIASAKRALSAINTVFARKNCVIPSNIRPTFSTVRHFSVDLRRNMKFVQFTYKNEPKEIRVGYIINDSNELNYEKDVIVDINKADPALPSTMIDILKTDAVKQVNALKNKSPETVPLTCVNLKAPIHGMDKVLCVGLNYKDHCAEQNKEPPPVPMIFSKFASCVVGPEDAVRLRTDVTTKVDWEVELCVVIGCEASSIKAENAYKYIAGCTVAQDISARDWQKNLNAGQFLLGKAMDTFCPIGPWISTLDEIGDPEKLDIKCSINCVSKQSSNTNQLIFKVATIIERLSSVMTLYPGDIILTGTPGGVGALAKPPQYLKPGDVIRSEIQCIGVLNTKVEKF